MAQRSKLFRPLVIAAATAAVTCLCSGVATAETGAQYVALGSSYAAGPGIEPMIDAGCARSARNYPHLLAAATGLSLVDVTCSGATTANLLDTPQRLVTGGSAPIQLDAVTADTRLVTISIGGNDLRLVGSMISQSCGNAIARALSLPDQAADALTRVCGGGAAPTVDTDYGRVEQSLIRVADAVRAKAPAARVLFVDYLPVLDSAAETCPAVPLRSDQAIAARAGYDGLLAATARAAGADRIAPPDHTHTACSSTPWVTGFAGTPDLTAIASSYHPNLAGMTAVAAEIATRIAG